MANDRQKTYMAAFRVRRLQTSVTPEWQRCQYKPTPLQARLGTQEQRFPQHNPSRIPAFSLLSERTPLP